MMLLALTFARTTITQAQQGFEIGIKALGTAARADFVGAGLEMGIRAGGRARFAGILTAGALDGHFGVRAELLGHFLLNPASSRPGIYAGGGLAGVAARGEEIGYVVLLLGLESHPGGRSGWALEAGIGGGLRLSAGYRWRRLKRR